MNKKMSFFGSAFFYTFGVIVSQGTAFVTNLIIAKMMTPDEFGLLSVYTIWVSIFGIILGVQAYGAMNNVRLDFGKEKLSEYTSSTLGLSFITFTIAALILIIFRTPFETVMYFPLPILLLCCVQGYFTFVINHIANKYRILNDPKKYVLWTTLASILRIGLSIVLIYFAASGEKYLGDIYGSVISYTVVGILAVIFIFKNSRTLYNKTYWKYCIKLCVPFIFSGLANLILAQSDRYMLLHLNSQYEAGIYSYVYNIALVATAIWTAFNNAWTVWYFGKTNEGKKDEIIKLYKKYSLFVTLFSITVTLLAPDVVRIFGGSEYSEGIYLTPLITSGCFFLFLYTFPVAYETYKQKTVYVAIGTLLSAGINILLNYFMIPVYGMYGAALATLISYVIMFLFHFITARFIIKGFEISFIRLLVPALYIIAAAALTYATLYFDILWLRWTAGILSLIFAYFVFKKSRNIMME